MSERIGVIVADDHPLYREGVARVIKRRPDLKLLAECEDGRVALAEIRRLAPVVAVLDVRLPGLDGLAVLEALQREDAPTRIVVVSAYEDSATVYRAIASGARAFLPKGSPGAAICDAIVAVARGDTIIPPGVQAGLAQEIRLRREHLERPVLTARELQILRLAADGVGTAGIAERLHLSATTVKTHLAHIYEKLEVSDRTAAVAVAMRRGVLE